MRKRILIIAIGLAGLAAVFYFVFWSDTERYKKYQRIQTGMSLAEVEELLGPGEIVPRDHVPMTVVAVNPDDPQASEARARWEGRSPMTARDYPTKTVPVVDGDLILVWESRETLEWIYVALKDGRVCGKHYRTLNYL
jgi:hypothetical protein